MVRNERENECGGRDVNYEEKVQGFFGSLSAARTTFEELRATFDERMAFDFNLLNFFYPGENKLSEILAFFLNPKAPHGQGILFIQEFCNLFVKHEKMDEQLAKEIKVQTEHPTDSNRRIDVTVEFGDRDFFIGIENKIWAEDQNGQVKDYCEFLKKESNGDYILFYLTPYGTEPSKVSIDEETKKKLIESRHLDFISYCDSIINLFERFIMTCKSEKVRYFLKEFQSYIQQQFVGGKDMDKSQYIRNFISENEDYQNVALDVFDNIDAVRDALWEKVNGELQRYFSDKKIKKLEVAQDFADMCSDRWKNIITIDNESWSLVFEFDGNRDANGFRQIITGRNDKQQRLDNEFLSELKKKIGFTESNQGHNNISTCPSEYYKSWRFNMEPWRDMIQKGENSRSVFTNKIIEVYEKANGCIEKTVVDNGD